MADRKALIESFLAHHGWDDAERYPLDADASFRRYVRLVAGNHSVLLMDAPPPLESVKPFVDVARHLHGLGLSTPEIFAEDPAHGLLLLEDFGDETFSRLLSAGADEEPLYTLAIDVLIALHRQARESTLPDFLPPYDEQALLDETLLLTDWYWPAVADVPITDAARENYARVWRRCFRDLADQPRTLVLRDYHVDNLMRLPDRRGVAACGLLDFQDALAGPAIYDVMSLLEDARRDIDPALKKRLLARYQDAFPALDWGAVDTTFAVLGAQRHAKVIGIFTRLSRRDGKNAYLSHIPHVWRMLERALAHPALEAVADWFERHIPQEKRIVPSCPSNPPSPPTPGRA